MSFFGSLFGSDQRKDLKNAKKASDKALNEGFNTATMRYDQGYSELEPYSQGGTDAYNRYNQLLGLGTDEQRASGQQTYLDDPIFGSMLNQQSNALLRQQNARGGTYGGQAVMAAGRLGLENYNNYLDRLKGQGDQGFQATAGQSNIRLGQGDAAWNYGATKAGSAINYGNAQAQNRSTGINNLLGIAGAGAKLIGAFSDIRLKRDITRMGETEAGLPVYEFSYVWGPERYRGVMAHEAREVFPDAVSVHHSGFLTVDYSKIG